jgi:thioredoxin reductase
MSNLESVVNPVDILIIGGGPAGMFAAFYGGMRQAQLSSSKACPS